MNTDALVQLKAECPECGRREARRVAKWRLGLYHNQDPARLAETVNCQGCATQYTITVRAYQDAS